MRSVNDLHCGWPWGGYSIWQAVVSHSEGKLCGFDQYSHCRSCGVIGASKNRGQAGQGLSPFLQQDDCHVQEATHYHHTHIHSSKTCVCVYGCVCFLYSSPMEDHPLLTSYTPTSTHTEQTSPASSYCHVKPESFLVHCPKRVVPISTKHCLPDNHTICLFIPLPSEKTLFPVYRDRKSVV